MPSIIQDFRFASRQLLRRPALALVAGVSMTAGISLAATVFSLIDAAVLRPLPVADPDRLGIVLGRRGAGSVNHNWSYPDFVDYRAGQRAFTDLIATGSSSVTARTQAGAVQLGAEMVSGSYFSMLGVGAQAGRILTEADEVPSAPPVAVVTESLWRDIAGSDASFDGRPIVLNGQEFAVVGIVASGFTGAQLGRDIKVWTTINRQPIIDPSGGQVYWNRRTTSWLTLIGRLKPGVSLEKGGADLNRIEGMLGPSVGRQEQRSFFLAPGAQGDSSLPGDAAQPLQLLLVAALLVVLVASANVANLLAARASDRERELAVRLALGAGRVRLIRLLVAEALLIGAGSATAALIVASWLGGAVVTLLPGLDDASALDMRVNWRVAGVVAALSLLTTLLASVAPIARVWRGSSRPVTEAGRAIAAGGGRLRRVLVVGQFALSLALVVAATLLIRTLVNIRGISTGLPLDRVVLMVVDPEAAGYSAARVKEYTSTALDRLAGVPGVRAAGFARVMPLGFGGSRGSIEVPGYASRAGEDMEINFNTVSPGYFDSLEIGLVSGRFIDGGDITGRTRVAVVNETMARRYWPNGAAVGRTFKYAGTEIVFEVIGIARDVKYRTVREEAGPSFYTASLQATNARGGVLHIRTDRPAAALVPVLRRTMTDFDRNVPVTIVRTLREQRDRHFTDESLAVTIGVTLGGVALALAAVGLFAAMSSAVGRRTREIGVRLALGARPARIVGSVLTDSLRLVLAGAAIGLVAAYWATGFVEQRLYGVTAKDPISFTFGVVLLSGVALVAAWAPALRAARVDPIRALRTE